MCEHNIDSRLGVALAWFTTHDLDLWVVDTETGEKIGYDNKQGIARNVTLDFDANAGAGENAREDPVENISFDDKVGSTIVSRRI